MQAERTQAERVQAERMQAERERAERMQAERERAELERAEWIRAERARAERVRAERDQDERDRAERDRAERERATSRDEDVEVPRQSSSARVHKLHGDASEVSSADAARAEATPDPWDELERAKERLARESEREIAKREHEVLASFVDVVDDLDRALASAEAQGGADQALMQGVAMVRSGLVAKLAGYGVEQQGEVGERFDPKHHEAVATAPVSDAAAVGSITAVVKHGYTIGDELLRPAVVVVGRSAIDPPSA